MGARTRPIAVIKWQSAMGEMKLTQMRVYWRVMNLAALAKFDRNGDA
jgi:hypothetical protein